MKVLSKGGWRHKFACEECYAVLMASEEDFKSQQKKGTQELQIACECPECGTSHVPESKDIPKDVWDRIMNRKTPRPDPFPTPFIHPDTRFK